MKSQFRDTFCGVTFLCLLMIYACCGCSKEATVNPSGGCYVCTVSQWVDAADGYSPEESTKVVELCNYNEALIKLYQTKNTYNEQRPSPYGFLTMYHSRATCSKK